MSESAHQVIKTRYRGHEIIARAYRNWYDYDIDGRTLYVISVSGTDGAVWARGTNLPRAMQAAIDGINVHRFHHIFA
jgi:hypothetical protein